jgi:hypothetical protein
MPYPGIVGIITSHLHTFDRKLKKVRIFSANGQLGRIMLNIFSFQFLNAENVMITSIKKSQLPFTQNSQQYKAKFLKWTFFLIIFTSFLFGTIPNSARASLLNFTSGILYTGVSPFDTSMDANGTNLLIRSMDYIEYRVTYASDSNGIGNNVFIRATLPDCQVPTSCTSPTYLTPPNPVINTVAVWDFIPAACQNTVQPPSVPTGNQSGLSADRQTLTCYLGNSTIAQTQAIDIRARLLALPNNTILRFPRIEISSDSTSATQPTLDNTLPLAGNGMSDVIVVSKPTWDLIKFNLNTGFFNTSFYRTASGPAGEAGYVIPFTVTIRKSGDPRGLEPLPSNLVIDDVVSEMPSYVRLMTWAYDYGSAGYTADDISSPCMNKAYSSRFGHFG